MECPRPLQGYYPRVESQHALLDLAEFLREQLRRALVRLPLRHAVVDESLALVRSEHQAAPLFVKQREFAFEFDTIVYVTVVDHTTALADDRLQDLLACVHLMLELLKEEIGEGIFINLNFDTKVQIH